MPSVVFHHLISFTIIALLAGFSSWFVDSLDVTEKRPTLKSGQHTTVAPVNKELCNTSQCQKHQVNVEEVPEITVRKKEHENKNTENKTNKQYSNVIKRNTRSVLAKLRQAINKRQTHFQWSNEHLIKDRNSDDYMNGDYDYGASSKRSVGNLGMEERPDIVILEDISKSLRDIAGKVDTADENNFSGLGRRRQVDALHTCIEAKCSGWGNNYMDCIYQRCITRLGHRKKRTPGKQPTPANYEKEKSVNHYVGSNRKRTEEEEEEDEYRRGFNDISDMCIKYHCGDVAPLTLEYFKCRDTKCGKRR